MAERAHNWTWFEQFPGTLLGLVRGGYTVVHLDDAQGGGDWSAPLPAFQEVTAEVLAHDLDDARRAQEGSLGCQPPGATALGDTFHCGAMPEGEGWARGEWVATGQVRARWRMAEAA